MIQRNNIGFKRLLRAVVSAVFSVVKFINQASIEHPTDGGTTICFDVYVLQKVRTTQLHGQVQWFDDGIDLCVQQIVSRDVPCELRRPFELKALDPFVVDAKTPS